MAWFTLVKRKTASPAAKKVVADKMGEHYPGKRLDTGDPVERERTVARLLGLILIMSASLNVVQGTAIASLIPLHKIEPLIITPHPKSGIAIEVMPIRQRLPGMDLYLEAQVKEWIAQRMRVIPDNGKMGDVIQWVFLRSTPALRDEYEKSSRAYVSNAVARGINRYVMDIGVTKQGTGFYVADYTVIESQTETLGGQEREKILTRVRWRAEMKISLRSYTISQIEAQNEKLVNPFGFTVELFNRTELREGEVRP